MWNQKVTELTESRSKSWNKLTFSVKLKKVAIKTLESESLELEE